MNKIIAVDFDGTLCRAIWPDVGTPNLKLISELIQRQRNGDKIILWTCREGKQLDDALAWCKGYGLIFDAVNDNLQEIKELYIGNSRKIFCDYYIDDKGYSPEKFCGYSV